MGTFLAHFSRCWSRALLGTALFLTLASPPQAAANPLYWDGNGAAAGLGGSGTWNTSSLLWRPDGTGSLQTWSSEVAVFTETGGNVQLNFSPSIKKESRFLAGGFVLTGTGATQTITLEGDGSLPTLEVNVTGSGSVTIGSTTSNQGVNLAGTGSTQIFRVHASDTLHLVNTVSNMVLTKDQAGTLILSGSNTYTGATNISAGVLNIRHANALGTTAGGVAITANAALELQDGIAVGAEAITSLSGSGVSGGGALRNISGNNSWAGAITVANVTGVHRINSDADTLTIGGNITETSTATNKDLTFGGAGNITVNGSITGSPLNNFRLFKDGAGRLTLSGTTAVSAVTIGNGAVRLGAADRIDNTATVAMNGGKFETGGFNETVGTLDVNNRSTIDLGSGASVLNFAASNSVTWALGDAILLIENWSGSLTGGGTDRLLVGTSASGLTAAQLAQVEFVLPTGLAAGNYGAKQLASGEIVPDGTVLVPEPGVGLMAMGSAIALLYRRRRRHC